MRTHFIFIMVVFTLMVGCAPSVAQNKNSAPQNNQQVQTRQMSIVGEIARGNNDTYIIRGQKPAEIFTILNANPGVLNSYVKAGGNVNIEVTIVSGDNINIKRINGVDYQP